MVRMRRCGRILHHSYPSGISQNRILLILKDSGPMKQRELMEKMNIQAGSLSEIIAKVEKAGYVERTRSDGDKRNLELRLTEAGLERAEIYKRHRETLASKLYSCLGTEEKEQLYAILEKLLEKWSSGDIDLTSCECDKDEGETNA